MRHPDHDPDDDVPEFPGVSTIIAAMLAAVLFVVLGLGLGWRLLDAVREHIHTPPPAAQQP